MSEVGSGTTAIAIQASSCSLHRIRGHELNVRIWGKKSDPPLVFLHGTQDSSITFQFVADHLAERWQIFSLDFRGHGHSQWGGDAYWFHDFLVDLDGFLDCFFPQAPVPLVGHSLGGNLAGIYAGLKPERVTKIVSLDGFGPLVNAIPVGVPELLSDLLRRSNVSRSHREFGSLEEAAGRLRRANPRLSQDKAEFLAEQSCRRNENGSFSWLFDPRHQRSMQTLHRIEDWKEIWSRVKAPVLWIASQDKRPAAAANNPEIYASRASVFANLTHSVVEDSGHNLHHDKPEKVAGLIDKFLGAKPENR